MLYRIRFCFLCILIVSLMVIPALGQTTGHHADSATVSLVSMQHQRVERERPAFRRNVGQWSPEILYGATARGAAVRFMKQGVSFAYVRSIADEKEDVKVLHSSLDEEHEEEQECLVWNVVFEGATTTAGITGEHEQAGVTSYLLGNDPSQYHRNVPEAERIWYRQLYPKIDLRYSETGGMLKYDYIMGAGGNVENIKMRCEGIRGLQVNRDGELEIETAWGIQKEGVPVAWQEIGGERRSVDVRYRIINNTTVGFSIEGGYRQEYELIIDPVILGWSTFVGGGGEGDGYLYNIALDADGNVVGVGYYNSEFPTTPGTYQNTAISSRDIFVFKLARDGRQLLYSTYVGGGNTEYAYDVAITSRGDAIVVGLSASSNFPVTPGTFDPTHNGVMDIVAFRLNSSGSDLVFSTYLGGSNAERIPRLAITHKEEVIVGASTDSKNYPTSSDALRSSLGGSRDGVVSVISSDGRSLLYSTYLGGIGPDVLEAIALEGNMVVAGGTTSSTDFPLTPDALDPAGTGLNTNGWLLKFSLDSRTIVYSTLLRGYPAAIAIAGDSSIVVAGEIPVALENGGFTATPGAYSTTYSGAGDVFVLRINPSGTALMFATFLGGDVRELVDDVGITFNGDIIVSGSVYALNSTSQSVVSTFPLTGCVLDSLHVGSSEGFISRLSGDGSRLIYSTFIGGGNSDYYTSLGLSPFCDESLVFGMTTHSPDFPTTPGAFQPVKLNADDDQPVILMLKPQITPDFNTSMGDCGLVTFNDMTRGECIWSEGAWTPNSWRWDFGDGTTSIEQSPTHLFAPGTYQISLVVGTPCDSITKTIEIQPPVIDVDFRMSVQECGIVEFTDLSQGDCVGGVKEWAPTSWHWDFGDGTTSTERTFKHEYAKAGIYQVKLIVGSPADSIMKTVQVEQPEITPDFTAEIGECGSVVFHDLTQGRCALSNGAWGLSQWYWDFGDGNTSSEQSPNHVYTSAGTYRVKLIVGMPLDSVEKIVEIPRVKSDALVRLHIDRTHTATLGSDISIPVMLDDDPDSLRIASATITFSYDTTMMSLRDDSDILSRLTTGTQLEDWYLQVSRPASGKYVITGVAPSGEILRGPGKLLSFDFTTFLRAGVTTLADSVWSSELLIDAVVEAPYCLSVATDPGKVTLGICGLRYRLVEMSAASNKLEAAHPNPFNPITEIPFSLAFDGPARLEVFNASGESVAVLIDEQVRAGEYMIEWNAMDYPSGMYYYRLSSGAWSQTRRMVVVK